MAVTAGATWRKRVLRTYTFDAAQMTALDLAASALDRAESAQQLLDFGGVLADGLHGPKASPAVAIKKDAVNEWRALVRLLGIFEPEAS